MLALADPPVEEAPQLRPLVLRIPLAEVVAEGEDALLGPSLLLVAPGSAERSVESVFLNSPEEGDRLQAVAAGARATLFDGPARVDVVLHGCDDQPLADLRHPPIAKLEDLGKVVTGVDVHDREGEATGPERFLSQAQQHDRVLAAAEEQHRPFEFSGHLAHDEDGLGLECVKVRQVSEARGCRSSHGLEEVSHREAHIPSCRIRPSGLIGGRHRARPAWSSACTRSMNTPGRAGGCR